MRKVIVLFLILFWSVSSVAASSIGVVTDVEGEVELLRNEKIFAVAEGIEVFNSDAISTGKDAKVQVDMVDGTNLLVGADTYMRFSEYTLDENNGIISAVVDVVSGWMRFAVAKLNDVGSYSIDTPTMTIGIRGTEGVIEAAEDKSGLFLDEGKVELYEVGETASQAVPLAMTAGNYAERLRGKRLRRQALRRAFFERRVPPRLRHRLLHRAHLLKQRGITPRMLRAARRQEIRRFLLRNPEARRQIRMRLRERADRRRELRQKRLQNWRLRMQQRMRQR